MHSCLNPLVMASRFVSEQVFKTKVAEQKLADKVSNWDDLEQNTIYKVNYIHERVSEEYGICHILDLEDRDENKIRVWSPKKLIMDLKEKRKPKDQPYITSLGKGRYKKNIVNKFDLMLEEGKEAFDLFEDDSCQKRV